MLRSETGPDRASGLWPPRIFTGVSSDGTMPCYHPTQDCQITQMDNLIPWLLYIVGRCSLPSQPAPPPHGHHLVGVSVSLSLRWWVQQWAIGEGRDEQSWFGVVFINCYLLYDLLGKGMEDLCSTGPPPPVPAVRVRQCRFPRRWSNR